MVIYRRNRAPGATYFFTLTLSDRSTRLLVDHIHRLRHAYALMRERHPFRTDAIVILPDHLHCIWTLPEGDDRYSMRWRLIKTSFTSGLRADGVIVGRRSNGERRIWQRRFREHTIRDADDLQRHVDYIHFNPVKHGHVERVADWPYSSLHRHVAKGLLPANWAGSLDAARVPGIASLHPLRK
jgi:putative transposase